MAASLVVPFGTCTIWYMAASTATGTKDRLLDAAMDYVAVHGSSGLSLRQLAIAIGTSHRMLIYHFGSKEGLLVEVIRTVEARQRDIVAELAIDPDLTPGQLLR